MDFGALKGLRVLDVSRLLPGPYCTMVLADHGAEVIAIEDRRFMADDLFFSDIYRNKRHMTLNLKSEQGLAVFYELAGKADVIVEEGFDLVWPQRLGIDYQAVAEVNPGIIYCPITGYGQDGPAKNEPGHDINYLSRAGVLDLIGTIEGPPSIPGVQIADIAGGSMQAVTGILLALYGREKSGKGQYIDISMTDGLLGLLTLPKHFMEKTGQPTLRSDALLSHRYACYNTYAAADGEHIAVGAVEKKFWMRLCDHLGRPDYGDLQYDEERRTELIAWLTNTIKQKNGADWEEELEGLEACCTRVRRLDEVMDCDLFQERAMVVTDPENGVKSLGIPVKLSESPGKLYRPAARFGQHTHEILGELGYRYDEVEAMRENGVI